MARLRNILALIAVVSVSGIHLPLMQAGAWAMMWRAAEPGTSVGARVHDYLSAGKVCERCLVTLQAGVASQSDSKERQRPASIELGDLRLIPSDFRPFEVIPPAPALKPVQDFASRPTVVGESAPACPPPEVLA